MKALRTALIALILAAPASQAQDRAVFAGAGLAYNFPVGSMHDRFNGAVGWMVFAGKELNATWAWTGKFEHFEFDKLNESNLTKTVVSEQNGSTQQHQVPLTGLAMSFKASGLTAEALLNIMRFSSTETRLHMGFGFYYWKFTRSGFYDSLFVQIPGSPAPVKVAELAVPANEQHDWSGSINLGADFSVNASGPVWVTLSADYRLIIGELWQALDLDLESVSGVQTLSLRAAVSVRF